MKKVVLDTNFILSCVRQKIDFLEKIQLRGMKILLPEEVLDEIKKIENSGRKLHLRENAQLALKTLEKTGFEKIKLETENVDDGLVKFSEKNKDVIIATLDRELKKRIKKPKLVIRGKKKLEII